MRKSELVKKLQETERKLKKTDWLLHDRTMIMNHYARMLRESEALTKKHMEKIQEMYSWPEGTSYLRLKS